MLVLVVVQVILFIFGCFAKDLSPSIPKCHPGDPKMGECIAKTANALRPYVQKGIKELGIPSLEPLHMPNYTLSQCSNLVNYSIDVWNYTISGLENYDITGITYHPENMTFRITIQFDSVLLKTDYRISGSLIHIPVVGTGALVVAFDNINGTFEIKGKMVKHKNVDHYNPKNLQIKLNIDDLSLHFDGLFDNNPTLGEFTNNMINQNSKLLLQATTPAAEAVAEALIMRYLKWLTKTFSYYQLFPRL